MIFLEKPVCLHRILREKDLSSNELEDIYVNIKNIIKDDTKIIINSDIALARRVKAYGLHLSFNDFLKYKKQNLNDSFVWGSKNSTVIVLF